MYFSCMGLLIWHITDNILRFLDEIKSQLITQDEFGLEVQSVQHLSAAGDGCMKSVPHTVWKHGVLQEGKASPPSAAMLFVILSPQANWRLLALKSASTSGICIRNNSPLSN